MAGLYNPLEQLEYARKGLTAGWERTSASWQDSVADAFHQQYITTAEQHCRATAQQMQQMLQVIEQAMRAAESL